MSGALDGIRVVDLTHTAPGPYCTMLLGDLGAEVIRVEEPPVREGRRSGRGTGAGSDPEEEARRNAFNALARNKRSIVLNLKHTEGREVFYRLAANADIVTESFRPGVVQRLGVDYESLRPTNPRLIYCSITGYGQDGPYRDLPGHDINYIALGGALALTASDSTPPIPPGNLVADFAGGGMHAALGILAAIVARARTGEGQYVDSSMTDGVMALMASYASNFFASGDVPIVGQHRHLRTYPWFMAYRTEDGKYFSLGCSEPWFYANLCRAVGREDMVPYQYDAGERRDEFRGFLEQLFLTKNQEEWFTFCREYEICGAPAYTIDEALDDPHMRHRGMVAEIDHPRFGKISQVASSMKLSATPPSIRRLAPGKGEHTDAVLRELGYTDSEIERLAAEGVLGPKSAP